MKNISTRFFEELIEENFKSKDPYLDLGRCSLTDLPEELVKMQWLEYLNFGLTNLTKDGRWTETANEGENNQLTMADWGILQNLSSLQGLFLDNCQLRMVPISENLPNLRLLRLENNEISDISPLAKQFPALEQLWLSGNRISDISMLANLSSLWKLQLSKNDISDIGSCKSLENLKHLDLSNNKIADLSPLRELSQLEDLKLDSNLITDISPLKDTIRLKNLSIASNNINSISEIIEIKDLGKLDIRGNQIGSVSPLSSLKNLQELLLSSNKITDISPLAELKSLILLDLNDNPFTAIQPLTKLTNLERLMLSSNQIKDCPPDIWQTGDIRQIRSWFQSQVVDDRQLIKENEVTKKVSRSTTPIPQDAKLVLVGNSSVGKTQLSRYLEKGEYEDKRQSTHGVRLKRWQPQDKLFENIRKKVAVNIWDFGGQEYYHGAYRLFLSNYAVYVLLWDLPTNINDFCDTPINDHQVVKLQHYDYYYWLENIRHYAPDSKILMVQNKIDLEKGKKHVSEKAFSDYGISWDYYISLKLTAQGDESYRRNFEVFCTDLDSCLEEAASRENPPKWAKIRKSLSYVLKGTAKKQNPFIQAAKNKEWIEIKDFETACQKIKPNLTPDDLHTLPRWFHNSGLVIYFGDHPSLKEKIFINPNWVTNNIYEILDETVLKNRGEFSRQQVEEKKPKLSKIFLHLMEEMEIIFERHDISGTYVAPQYLPDHHPAEHLFAIAAGGLQRTGLSVRLPLFYFRKVLLKILHYFGSSEKLDAKYFWRNGILFEKSNIRVLVQGLKPKAGDTSGTIVIGAEQVGDYKERQREVFEYILDVLENSEWRKHMATEGSSVSSRFEGWTKEYRKKGEDDPGKERPRWLNALEISADGRRFVSFLDCCFAGQDGELFIKFNDDEKIPLRDFEPLLDQTRLRPHRVFLSYSHTDSNLLNRLRMHLSPLRRMKNVESWSDQELLPGDQWDELIKDNLGRADIIILLLTADFIASDYIWNVELKEALKKSAAKKVRLIPILLQPLDYGALRLDDQLKVLLDNEMIPKNDSQKLVPVTLWQNQEEAFAKIAARVRTAIEE